MATALHGVHYQVKEFMTSFDVAMTVAAIPGEVTKVPAPPSSAPADSTVPVTSVSGEMCLASGWEPNLR